LVLAVFPYAHVGVLRQRIVEGREVLERAPAALAASAGLCIATRSSKPAIVSQDQSSPKTLLRRFVSPRVSDI
jgi:hypothetical protein